MNSILREICLLLILIVPCLIVSNRLHFGSILGLLAGGILIGPSGFGLIQTSGAIHNIADVGVILFLFLVGLELHPAKIGKSWRRLLVFGILQILLTGVVLSAIVLPISTYWTGALVGGFTLAMSSTALVFQTLRDRNELNTKMGQTAVAILIVQDLAVIPLLAIIPIINPTVSMTSTETTTSITIIGAVTAIALLLGISHFIAPRIIEHLDRKHDSNSLAALIGLIVLGSAFIADSAGLSMALGGFIAGVSLSTSSSAKRIDQLVRPHQTLLMALFFVSVGLSINRHEISGSFTAILIMLPCVLIAKFLCLYALGRVMGSANRASWRLALLLSQAGEFGFVVLAACFSVGWATATQVAAATTVIAFTMVATPIIQRFVPPLGDLDRCE